jgi:CDP-glucose 4,6-dehydratase
VEGVVSNPDAAFWRGRRVLLTGHTGFKGAWLALWLERLGAEVSAFALPPEAGPNLFHLAKVAESCDSRIQDLQDSDGVARQVRQARPQIVLHLAAQALVRRSLAMPVETFAINVLGTINLLQALRELEGIEAVLVVTSDKVYANDGSGRAICEADPLGGDDPYSASKAACELAVNSMRRSFLSARGVPVATARAGNVIGGGDFAEDRVVPDCVRAAIAGRPVVLRHPRSTRPWQHVLDCLCGYLLYAERLASAPAVVPQALNFGPASEPAVPVVELASAIMEAMDSTAGIEVREPGHSVEAPLLSLDSTLARRTLGWRDRLSGPAAIEATAMWYRRWQAGEDMRAATVAEIDRYQAGEGKAK